MANAGYSADKKFITEAIQSGKLLTINKSEQPIIQIFKEKINNLLLNDVVRTETWNGKKYDVHSAWGDKYNLLIKMNQIRQKNWFWDRLV